MFEILYPLTLLLAFGACTLLVLGLGKLLTQHRVRQRLRRSVAHLPPPPKLQNLPKLRAPAWQAVVASLSRLSVPQGGWQDSQRRLKFVRAGFREASAAQAYYAFKTTFSLVLPLLLALVLTLWWPVTHYSQLALSVVLLAVAGYYLPDLYLRFRTHRRAKEMRDTLPDLIDLLVICTESGLGMDAAINRVSREIARSSKTLAEEFYLAALEIRAGAGRTAALKNLALRVDLEDLHSLVSMLVQADRFGTSLADSLRIHSDVMRTQRMQRAEEIAAKVPVKMLIPLIFFIFPSLLTVLIGPAVIQIAEIFSK
jgi:tight adherence protein C